MICVTWKQVRHNAPNFVGFSKHIQHIYPGVADPAWVFILGLILGSQPLARTFLYKNVPPQQYALCNAWQMQCILPQYNHGKWFRLPCIRRMYSKTAFLIQYEYEQNKNHLFIVNFFCLFAGFPFHQHFAVIDCVLPFACRNYSTNVTCRAFTGKIRALHNDIRHIQVN